MIGGNAIVMKLALAGISLKASQVRNRTKSITLNVIFYTPCHTVKGICFLWSHLFKEQKNELFPSGAVSLIEGNYFRSSETRPDGVSYQPKVEGFYYYRGALTPLIYD